MSKMYRQLVLSKTCISMHYQVLKLWLVLLPTLNRDATLVSLSVSYQ